LSREGAQSLNMALAIFFPFAGELIVTLECGPMPNLMVALPNIGGALC